MSPRQIHGLDSNSSQICVVLISTPINKDCIKLLATKSHDLNAFKIGRKTNKLDQSKEKNKDGLEVKLHECLVGEE